MTLQIICFFERDPRVELGYLMKTKVGIIQTTSHHIAADMPVTKFNHPDPYKYQTGFDSYHEYVYT